MSSPPAADAPAADTKADEAKPKPTGTVLFAGGTDWAMIGKTGAKDDSRADTYPILPAPTILTRLASIPIAFVAAGPAALHALAGAADGTLYAWGRNDRGQLGLGDTRHRNAPARVDLAGRAAVAAAAGRAHTLVALADGTAVSAGLNSGGQLGAGAVRAGKGAAADDVRTSFGPCQGIAGCTAVAAGADFSMWLCTGGRLWSAGHPQYGVLGHGTDHEYNAKESSVKLKYEPQPTPRPIGGPLASKSVARVACGVAHTLALTSDGCAYTWGNGGYGRLGHAVQQDEFAPRLVEGMTGRIPADPTHAACAGATATYCTGPGGQLYAWGKLKVSGDNTMRPTPVMDLAGWTASSMASGGATFFAAAAANDGDKAAVAWGHALHGELGFGKGGKKSSAAPDLVESLRGATIHDVAAGAAFSLWLVDADDKVKADLPEWASSAPDAEGGGAGDKRKAPAGGAAGKKKK